MKFKFLLSLIIPAVITVPVLAQDRIFQSNGNVIKARIVAVNTDDIVYKLWNHDGDREYRIAKNDVDKIKYEGGKQEWFDNKRQDMADHTSGYHEVRMMRRERNKMKFGNKILAFAPLQLTDQGIGVAINYEQGLDKDGIVSFNLPLVSSINIENNNRGYNYYGYNNQYNHEDAMFYFCPGLKFYPTSMFGKVKYSIGPSLVLGVGQQTNYDYYYAMPYNNFVPADYGTHDRVTLGVMITNSLNISPTKHFYMGIDYGLGFNYLDRVNGLNHGMSEITQFSFKLGYRF